MAIRRERRIETTMKNKNIQGALLGLLGLLPRRVEREQETMRIVYGGEDITVNELVKRTLSLLSEAIKGKEEEE